MSDDNQRAVTAVASSAVIAVADEWRNVNPEAVSATWTARLPRAVAIVTTAQIAAAAQAKELVDPNSTSSMGTVNPVAFGGVASSGLLLSGLLVAPVFTVLSMLNRALSPKSAMAAGLVQLDMLVRTQVADANRSATGVAITADPDFYGYERVVHLPACGRCIILAGRVYRWSTGFLRHPRCDCTMRPVTREQHRTLNLDNNPRTLFEHMTPEQQVKAFTKAGARAIRDGADLSQVVNARAGMRTAVIAGQQVQVTTSGATKRGTAGNRLGASKGRSAVRLMPEAIYQVAKDRDDAIRLLRLNGYIL